jgi:hypothetical protein
MDGAGFIAQVLSPDISWASRRSRIMELCRGSKVVGARGVKLSLGAGGSAAGFATGGAFGVASMTRAFFLRGRERWGMLRLAGGRDCRDRLTGLGGDGVFVVVTAVLLVLLGALLPVLLLPPPDPTNKEADRGSPSIREACAMATSAKSDKACALVPAN